MRYVETDTVWYVSWLDSKLTKSFPEEKPGRLGPAAEGALGSSASVVEGDIRDHYDPGGRVRSGQTGPWDQSRLAEHTGDL